MSYNVLLCNETGIFYRNWHSCVIVNRKEKKILCCAKNFGVLFIYTYPSNCSSHFSFQVSFLS